MCGCDKVIMRKKPSSVIIPQKWRFAGRQRAQLMHLVDLDGAKAGHPVNLAAIRAIVKAIEIPCELGGGLRDEASIRTLLNDVGVDRAIIGTRRSSNPNGFETWCNCFRGGLRSVWIARWNGGHRRMARCLPN